MFFPCFPAKCCAERPKTIACENIHNRTLKAEFGYPGSHDRTVFRRPSGQLKPAFSSLGRIMREVSFCTPLESIHVVIDDAAVTIAAPQIPDPAEWAAAWCIARDCCDSSKEPDLFFDDFFDIWVFPRI